MATAVTELKVFVASPSDLAAERNVVGRVAAELNLSLGDGRGVRLEVVKWESHVAPGVGEDPQAVINEQIGDDFDIFVGILWSRFGTKTRRAGSGTEEEFNRAFERVTKDPDSLRLMLYFKNQALRPDEIDPKQLASVQNFKKKTRGLGVLSFDYSDLAEFERNIRLHLAIQVNDYGGEWARTSIGSPTELSKRGDEPHASEYVQEPNDAGLEETDDEGFLDVVESAEDNMNAATAALEHMTDAIGSLGESIAIRTEEISNLVTSGDMNTRSAKTVSNRTAEDFEVFAEIAESQIPVFAKSFLKAIDNLSKGFVLRAEMDPAQSSPSQEEMASIVQLRTALEDSRSQLLQFRTSVAGMPRMTTRLNRARKRAVEVLDRIDSQWSVKLKLISELEQAAS